MYYSVTCTSIAIELWEIILTNDKVLHVTMTLLDTNKIIPNILLISLSFTVQNVYFVYKLINTKKIGSRQLMVASFPLFMNIIITM